MTTDNDGGDVITVHLHISDGADETPGTAIGVDEKLIAGVLASDRVTVNDGRQDV